MKDLFDFIENRMRMSHIYQPVMIKALLEADGEASRTEIAEIILSHDFSQVEYYESVVANMVGRVLVNNGVVNRTGKDYELLGFSNYSEKDRSALIELCNQKIDAFKEKRGDKIWEHRRRNRRPVKGSTRYEVLKRAKGRCELCGISKEEKALEVDHITPKNNGGEDSIDNYQALCYTCNSNKRDKDDTDFREMDVQFSERAEECIFCHLGNSRIIDENPLAIAMEDKYAVTEGHTLIIPKRHCPDYFSLHQAEINAMNRLSFRIRDRLSKKDSRISGYNLGFNAGEDAGQTIFHCHMHLIPRRSGDVQNPRGGIRNVIDGKGDYAS